MHILGVIRLSSRSTFLVLFLALVHHQIGARDFMERPRAIILQRESTAGDTSDDHRITFLPAVYAESALHYQLFQNSPEDEFQIRSFAHFGVFDAGNFRSTVYYGNFMYAGPVNEGDEPGAEAAQWMMNAVQFEYGLTFQYALGDWTLLTEYSRRSYHPLRKTFAQPAADIVRVGVSPPWFYWRGLVFESLLRFSRADLYDFWGSTLPQPRAIYTVNQAFESRYGFRTGAVPILEVFALVLLDTNIRRAGGVDSDLALQGGMGIGSEKKGRLEIFLDYYYSADTEQRTEVKSPANLLGYGVRLWVIL